MTKHLAAIALVLAALAGRADADSARPLALDELIDLSDEIVVGAVVGSTARWQGNLVVTDTVVRVDEALKGTPPRDVTLTQPGGTAMHPRLGAEVTTQASTFTALGTGETVVLFVDRKSGTRQLVGAQQGKLVVEPGAAPDAPGPRLAVGPKTLRATPAAGSATIAATGMTLDTLRARVAARTGAAGGAPR